MWVKKINAGHGKASSIIKAAATDNLGFEVASLLIAWLMN